MFSSLFLEKEKIPTIEIDPKQHIYRCRQSKSELVKAPLFPRLRDDERTVHHVWSKASETNAHKPGFGYRKLVKIHTKEKEDSHGKKKRWIMYELEGYKWTTYGEAKTLTDRVASWLHAHGLRAGDRLLIYSKTRPEWMQMALACFSLGVVVSTAYDSMPPEAVAHIMQETEPKAVFTEVGLMGTLNKAKKKSSDKSHTLDIVVYAGEEFEGAEELETFKQENKGKIEHWSTIAEGNAGQKGTVHDSSPRPDDLALIMYTSGTTGTPKGIEVTHGNLVAAMGAAEHLVVDILNRHQHSYIGFLPLAHILEFILEFIFITMAIPIGYGTIRTLMPDSVCGKDGQGKGKGDLESLRPTILAGVPVVWERIRRSVLQELDKQHWTVRKAFDAAVEAKWQLLKFFGQENAITRLFDSTVFAPIRQRTGGRLMYGLSGGAPLSLDTHKFVTTTLCFLLQGYGLTECCGLGAITLPSLGIVTGAIGAPSPALEFRLVDVPETDYKAENGTGELWIRGPSLMRGYYKREDLTKEAIQEDGWFKTGDVAELRDDGSFAITDRAKNLVKLAHGEYIALESLESKYRNCSEIKNICIVADSNKDHIVAIVEPTKNNPHKDALLKSLQETARQSDCNRAEIVKDIHVTQSVDWAEKYLTTSGKLKRKDIEKDHEEEIKTIYN